MVLLPECGIRLRDYLLGLSGDIDGRQFGGLAHGRK
jgi:hypothetical protein